MEPNWGFGDDIWGSLQPQHLACLGEDVTASNESLKVGLSEEPIVQPGDAIIEGDASNPSPLGGMTACYAPSSFSNRLTHLQAVELQGIGEGMGGIISGSKRKINSLDETSLQQNLEFPNKASDSYMNPGTSYFNDLESLRYDPIGTVIDCARAMDSGNRRYARDRLNYLKSLSSLTGSATRRLVYCLVRFLEPFFSGNKDFIYQNLLPEGYARAYDVYSQACPSQQAVYILSNETILDLIPKASKVHIIDFGIGLGFQWRQLFERLNKMPNESLKKLRITGIDVAQPGDYNINKTGEYLKEHATNLNVPFEFKGIESKWEDVSIESLNIDKDELLIVNCLSHSGYISTNSLSVRGPSDEVLKTIRELNPDAFIHGMTNSESDSPSFTSHIKEVFLHYNALFDMADANVPKKNDYRLTLERYIFGREIDNVVACWNPGLKGPETIKQWEARCKAAGFMQFLVKSDIIENVKQKTARSVYKDNFVIEQENGSVFLGWKGKKVFTLSVWKPNESRSSVVA